MSDTNQYAIRAKNVSKHFRLPHQKTNSVKGLFLGVFDGGSRTYEEQVALKGVSFDVKKGEFLGIVGRNGSGKSTLLKILAGIYQPTKGSVQVNGKVVPFIELGVGFNGELSGRENVFLNGALLGFSRKQIAEKYDQIVAFSELEKFMDQRLKNYSSGMQVRLAFSVATVLADSEILLIDEVLAVGDAAFQKKSFAYFREIKRLKKTVIFVSHDMGAIRDYCTRAILIDKSKIVTEGRPEVVASQYHRLFSGSDEERRVKKKGPTNFSGEERWGDGKAKIVSVDAAVHNPSKKDGAGSVDIKVVIEAVEDIQVPIVGFSIKNVKLAQLLGTNTQRKKFSLPPLKSGQRTTVKWSVENMFNEGRYYVDATVAWDYARSVADRWPDATSFEVSREDNTPYEVYPSISVTKE
ncbi:polysaccharide/polyol phosphate ABC transporter ATP-binding protein [Candidatus Saccharibacteria bacterium]|nr:MAG: polysaccharide/polyol phosphate ABC transporter ATP-binding protein [Candidatus Saccharibacteria bacterium]